MRDRIMAGQYRILRLSLGIRYQAASAQEIGPTLKHRNSDGFTPLHFARSFEVVQLLLKNDADVNARSQRDDSNGEAVNEYRSWRCPVGG
jgi:ankyrin repeat protein